MGRRYRGPAARGGRDDPAHRAGAARDLPLLPAAPPGPLARLRRPPARLRAADRGVPRLVLRRVPHGELHQERRDLPVVTNHELRELFSDQATRRRGRALPVGPPPAPSAEPPPAIAPP